MADGYDLLIVGGGAAGCVLAARLSEDPSLRVLVLEAGPDYVELPAALRDGSGPHTASHDWGLSSEPGSVGRAIALPRGKVIGGSSTTNAAFALRGSPYDFDAWAARGNRGWGWEDVLPWFVAVENDLDFGHEPHHGGHGPLPVRRYAGEERSAVAAAGQAAIEATGVPAIADHNAPGAVGVGPLPVNEVDGERLGAASTYLAAARARRNLTVRGGAPVDRVVLERGRAVGVRLADGEDVFGDHVIVASGTYSSPAILLRSGLGPADELRAAGIEPVLDLPGVGRGLADHPAVSVDVAYAGAERPRRRFQLVATLHSEQADAHAEPPDLQLIVGGPFDDPGGAATGATFFVGGALLTPRSRGRIRLRSPDPLEAPRIDLGYFSHPADLPRLVEAVRRAWRVARAEPLDDLSAGTVSAPDDDGDAAVERFVRAHVWTYHHPVGTCAMGPSPAAGAVVDPAGRVHGLTNLRVVDASIMPDVPSANTHVPTLMLAERIAASMRATGAAGGPGRSPDRGPGGPRPYDRGHDFRTDPHRPDAAHRRPPPGTALR
ncbi:GMC family oxidoreductase [Streptomyces sp. NPDC093225]|uniref:GMC family oxidoreductase n=1 Tax=Streptomyces sp. NPDC093225 TaxID=3366034 RepID=UPI00380A5473